MTIKLVRHRNKSQWKGKIAKCHFYGALIFKKLFLRSEWPDEIKGFDRWKQLTGKVLGHAAAAIRTLKHPVPVVLLLCLDVFPRGSDLLFTRNVAWMWMMMKTDPDLDSRIQYLYSQDSESLIGFRRRW